MIKNILKNWKTSLLGGGALTAAVTNYATNPADLRASVFMALLGLIGLFAADGKKPPAETPLKG